MQKQLSTRNSQVQTRSSSTEDIELLIYNGTLRPHLIDMCNTTSLSCNHMSSGIHTKESVYCISLKNKQKGNI